MILRSGLAALVLISVSANATARPVLDHASPSPGSIVHRRPSEVVLTFKQLLLPSGTEAVVRNGSGAIVSSGKSRVTSAKAQLEVPVGPLPPGKYRVEWYATSTDRQHGQGSFSFTVAEDGSAAAARSRKSKRRPN